MAQLSLPNAPIPDIYRGRNEAYKSLGQLLGLAGARRIASTQDAEEVEAMRQQQNELLNTLYPPKREAAQYTPEQAQSPDLAKKILGMEPITREEIEGPAGPAGKALVTDPNMREYIPKGTSRKTIEGLQDDILKSTLGMGPKEDVGLYARTTDLTGPSGKTHRFGFDPTKKGYAIDMGPIPTEEFKTGSRQQVVLDDGRVVDTFFDATSKKLMYWDTKDQSLKVLDKPYSPAGMLLSPQDVSMLGVPYGTTKGQAANMKLASVPQAKRETLSQFETAINILNDVKQYSERVNTFEAGPAGIGRAYQGTANWIAGKTQTDPNVTALMNKVGQLAMIIRALGEKGTLAEGDVTRGLKLIPHEFDTKPVAEQKLRDLSELFAQNKATVMQSLTSPIGGLGATPGQQPSQKSPSPAMGQRTVTRRGKEASTGRTVVQYSDGSVEYAD